MTMPKSQQSSGHDDSAYGGQKFDVEKNQFPEDTTAPELQLNRKGLGTTATKTGPPMLLQGEHNAVQDPHNMLRSTAVAKSGFKKAKSLQAPH